MRVSHETESQKTTTTIKEYPLGENEEKRKKEKKKEKKKGREI